jgi:glycosyltransferase involved in cell wall biosynthesis
LAAQRQTGRRFRIASSAAIGGEFTNPYTRLFYEALAPWGVRAMGPFEATRAWLDRHEDDFDALHFHWPEAVVRRDTAGARRVYTAKGGWRLRRPVRWMSRLLNLRELRRFVCEASRRGKRVLWTCHNLKPHEDEGWAIAEGIRAVAGAADLIIAHDAATLEGCERTYHPTARLVTMSHGNYDGVYPRPRPAADVRAALGLSPGTRLVSCVGEIRPYKGIEQACRAVSALGPPVSLLVAGYCASPRYRRAIRREIEAVPGAVLVDRALTDQEFADVVGASDAVLLPYREITGSGAVLAALSLGRGVVASDLPFFESLLAGHPLAGRTFRNGDVRDFAEAITAYLAVPDELRRTAARNLSAEYAWPRVIRPIAEVIDEWCRRAGMDRSRPA